MLPTPSPPKLLATTNQVVLRDGSTLHVRPLERADEDALHDFFSALSPDSRAFGFLSLGVNLRAAARHAADVDGRDRVGLVAIGPDGRIVALVRADNRRMVEVFRESGFPTSVRARSGVVEVELPARRGRDPGRRGPLPERGGLPSDVWRRPPRRGTGLPVARTAAASPGDPSKASRSLGALMRPPRR